MPSGRKMASVDLFVKDRVDAVLVEYMRVRQSGRLPIDLLAIAEIAGVSSVREIEMIPEAVIRPAGSGFEVFLQKNFIDFPGFRQRQRFSLAHEIAHTFFFEPKDGGMKRIGYAPTGDRLESACHAAAGLMLVPESLFRSAIGAMQDFPRARQIMQLAARFDVSVEVVIRRLPMKHFETSERALVVTRGPKDVIEHAVYPPWLKAILPAPKRGLPFDEWFRTRRPDVSGGHPAGTRALMVIDRLEGGTVSAVRVELGPQSAIYELSLDYLR